MVQRIRFKKDKVKKLGKNYLKLDLDDFQREAIEKIALVMKHYLDLKLRAIKGSMWLTIRQWQQEKQKKLSDIYSLARAAQEESIVELISLGKRRIEKMMVQPKDHREALNTAFQAVVEAVKIFLKRLNKE